MPTAANTIPAPITTPTTIPASAPGGRSPFLVRVPTVDPFVGLPEDGGDVAFPGAGAETVLTNGGGAGGDKVELASGGAGGDVAGGAGGCEVITGDYTVTFDALSEKKKIPSLNDLKRIHVSKSVDERMKWTPTSDTDHAAETLVFLWIIF